MAAPFPPEEPFAESGSGLCEGFRLEQTLDLKQVARSARTGRVLSLPSGRGFLASEAPADCLGSG